MVGFEKLLIYFGAFRTPLEAFGKLLESYCKIRNHLDIWEDPTLVLKLLEPLDAFDFFLQTSLNAMF